MTSANCTRSCFLYGIVEPDDGCQVYEWAVVNGLMQSLLSFDQGDMVLYDLFPENLRR